MTLDSLEILNAKDSPILREWLSNVYPLYLHDLSEFDKTFYQLDERGRWAPDHLQFWLTEETAHPLVIRAASRSVGFAFVGKAPFKYMTPGMDYHLAEFFILRRYRRTGLGRRAAMAIFDALPGWWELEEIPANVGAIRFWRKVIGEYTNGDFNEEVAEGVPRQKFYAGKRS
jgi:predicted acetyltransferase